MSKLREKNCDFIIANDVSKKDTGFNSEFNKVLIINNHGIIRKISKNKKSSSLIKLLRLL